LTAVSKAIDRWHFDPARAKFRTWLHRIAHNFIINALTRGAPDRGVGGDASEFQLTAQAACDGPDSDLVRMEFRREVFRWAAERIRNEFQAKTWDAFWMTAVEDESVEMVAKRLDVSCGAVYAARSRIMRRLKEKVREFDEEEMD
jgi:RNA polymerase sigma-70 factor (ECF subfamily)